MRNRRVLIGLVAVLFSFPVIAQDSLTSVKDIKKQARTESADTLSGIWSQNWILKLKPHNGGYQLDTVSVLYEKYFGVLNYLNDPATPERYIAYNPDYYRLFVPTTYYYAPMERLSQVNWTFQKQDTAPAMTKELLPFDTLSFLSKENANRVVDRVMMNTYVNRPDLVEMTEKEIKKTKVFKDNIEKEVSSKPSVAKLFAQEKIIGVKEDAEVVIQKPNWWVTGGNGSLQITQNYISDNWYKGGESTNSLLSGLVLEANFDDRQRLEFENKLEMKLGFVTAPSDTVHKYKTNADLFRLNSKLGVKAFKNWYYTLAAEFKTQFFANYKTNTNDMISNFMSPAQLDITLGMDFKQNKKNYTLSLLTSPLAYTFMYISNDKITDPAAFNVEPGHSTANLIGSKFTGNLTWTIIPSIVWESKLEYFTTYDKVIASWENTFNFVLNRYLSTKLFVHARYDDGVKLTEDNKSYFQLQELLSFGLNYTW